MFSELLYLGENSVRSYNSYSSLGFSQSSADIINKKADLEYLCKDACCNKDGLPPFFKNAVDFHLF